jgi:hypothetical protein
MGRYRALYPALCVHAYSLSQWACHRASQHASRDLRCSGWPNPRRPAPPASTGIPVAWIAGCALRDVEAIAGRAAVGVLSARIAPPSATLATRSVSAEVAEVSVVADVPASLRPPKTTLLPAAPSARVAPATDTIVAPAAPTAAMPPRRSMWRRSTPVRLSPPLVAAPRERIHLNMAYPPISRTTCGVVP